MDVEKVMEFACLLAVNAGKAIKEAFEGTSVVSLKSSPADLVTETDQLVEKLIIEGIKKEYPSHHFIGEESVADGGKCNLTNEPTWIVDPIDGTTNFVHRVPMTVICMGFCLNGKPVAGLVYNPITCEMFHAIRGKGAFCNGRKLKVSAEKDMTKSLIMTEFGSSLEEERLNNVFTNMRSVLSNPIHGIRSFGTCAVNMCQVALGTAQGYYEFGVHCWDYCAASVIVEEAGGVCIDTKGGDLDLMSRRIIAACNPEIARAISGRIKVHMELTRD